MAAAGLTVEELWESAITFRYPTAEAVLEHLLKSGAGTAFYEAVDSARRAALEKQFLTRLTHRNASKPHFDVVHDYVTCIAVKR